MVNKKDKKKIIAATAAGLLYNSQSKRRDWVCKIFGKCEDKKQALDQECVTYGPYPITLQGYDGEKKNSVAYTGQIARHILHESLKKAAGQGNSQAMMAYFKNPNNEIDDIEILAPSGKGKFRFKQKTHGEISTGKNLSGKIYKGSVNGWGGMTAEQIVEFMIEKAGETEDGFDPTTGYDYQQLLSKFIMGAVFYYQAVDNYLGAKLEADNKPNDKPYKKGKHYTGKEHSWDEAWGYWGAPAHSLCLTAEQNYSIAKRKDLEAADYDGDNLVDLKFEHCYSHAYYAAAFDKGGKTDYLATINKAFIDGRNLINSAKGEILNDDQREKLKAFSIIIKENWQKVIAEAIFKYAGSTYKNIVKIQKKAFEGNDTSKEFRDYAKHWGELKGFALALGCSSYKSEIAPTLHKIIGLGPVLLNNSKVVMVDTKGYNFGSDTSNLEDYKNNMIDIQKIMLKEFDLTARINDLIV
ncbi:Domain of unknown function (DUF4856) [seawater metagenome]|uniref:DUF4856 domain-containing protein n=1 Tax=seawater metagenome TaxID=1561972 RepID=A0A5E8CL54_9ZZZZ